VHGDGSAATAVLGLDGFVLLAVSEYAGELEQAVETTATEAFCAGCGVQARLHDRRPTWVRDLPAGGRPVTLVWIKRVWRCVEPLCAVATWTETAAAIRARASLTERSRREACRRVGQDGHSVAQVAADLGVGWATVMVAVREYGRPLVDAPERLVGVTALGVDETAFLAANAAHHTLFVTGIVDVRPAHGRPPRLLDVVAGRSGTALSSWVLDQPAHWRAGIEVAALDPFRGYATALRTSLPAATRVLDCFHVTRLGFAAVDDVRRRVQQDSTGHRGRRDDPLWRIRRVLRRGADNLTPHGWDRLLAGLEAGDVDAQIGKAWIAAQDLRLIYRAKTREQAARRLHRWLVHCADSDVPELHRLARTIDSWRTELLAYFDTDGVSNGPTEATNLLIKKIKRVGHGFRNLNNYRLRLLLHCGVDWQTAPTTPLRGRLPRLAA
jgi:transposase